MIMEYSHQHHPLLIWDSLVQFHNGNEQSATQTRAFMTHFRALANLGATVLVLHHTGKTPASQDYRGLSDIKAAVDMAYCLESEMTLAGGIYRLTLRNFKARFALGRVDTPTCVWGKGPSWIRAIHQLGPSVKPLAG